MTIADEVERFTRERQEADRRYNGALTALDAAVVAASDAGELARIGTALMEFLQRITAFVESKDREIVSTANARMAAVERALDPVAELRMQMSVVQRAIQALTRAAHDASPPPPAASTERPRPSAPPSAGTDAFRTNFKYVAFEDQFRGSDAVIAERLRMYVPIFAGGDRVLDLGCGRGELLAAFRSAGVRASGVDANADMVAIARGRGLEAVQGDALAFLETVEDESLGGIIATQVVEHLEPAYLLRLIDAASRKLRRGAPIVLETINVACWPAFFGSYLRDFTHVRPVHPDTLQYLLRASGFERVEIRFSAPVPDHMKMRTVDLPPGIAADPALTTLAHAVNANAVILNNLMFTHLDYAAVGYRA
jgi:O-antigen chain-terminating methyltransferase